MTVDTETTNILIVDDEPANIKILMLVLADQGYEVRTALSGQLAISSAVARVPDLIMLDVRMPDMDGFEVCRQLKADDRVRHVPVIFISALGETADIVEGLGLGGADYITKPFQIEEVLARVETHLSIQALQKQLKNSNDQLRCEIDERRSAQKALETLNEQLEQRVDERTAKLHSQTIDLLKAKEAAEAASIAKSKFLSNLSHELRTPLNPIMGYAQILKGQDNLTETQKGQLQVVYDSCVHLTTLISNILELVRIDTHPENVENVDFNFKELLNRVTRAAQKKAQKKNLSFRYEEMDGVPEVVNGDGRMLHHVLQQILDNAVKYTDVGGVTLRSSIDPCDQTEGKWKIRIEVLDTGVGIPDDITDDIFRPFFQGEIDGRLNEGTGLGLTLSKRIVTLMGGRISVQSPCTNSTNQQGTGPGSIFTVELDFHSPGEKTDMETESPGTLLHEQTPDKRLLIVDDNSANLDLLVHALKPLGYIIAKARSGSEALVKASQTSPDLVLLDLLMPVMDGAEVLANLRCTPSLSDVKVIGISAAVDNERRLATFVEACDDFIEKPVDIEKLRELVRKHLAKE